jgi:hypothetical protein
MKYCEKLERVSYKMGAKFLDYRPETGSWVFEVNICVLCELGLAIETIDSTCEPFSLLTFCCSHFAVTKHENNKMLTNITSSARAQ